MCVINTRSLVHVKMKYLIEQPPKGMIQLILPLSGLITPTQSAAADGQKQFDFFSTRSLGKKNRMLNFGDNLMLN